ncbi:MAG: fibronectin type III domain-containing protein [Acidobacteria bacterium]|nr:fibronectin type III domain-containing protein [Acidobacteriota bacterium]
MKMSWRYVLLGVLALISTAVVLLRDSSDRHHTVTLTWNAAAPPRGGSLAGYNVYRRIAEGGPFVKIAGKVPGSPYDDRFVTSGRKYVYVVTSVDQTGRESRYSTPVEVQIP